MTRRPGVGAIVTLALLPALLAAADPAEDVRACRGGGDRPGDPPDLVRAEGEIVELGTSATWTLTFAEPLSVPDRAGHPFRVDVVLHDPDVPALSFGYYRNANRLVRVDATVERPTEIYLLPERGSNVFNPPVVEGNTMRIQVPGRTLSDDEDLTGTSPGLEALRWTVIVRDELACDFLGDGRPTRRLVAIAEPSPSPRAEDPAGPASATAGLSWMVPAAVTVVLLGFLAIAYARRGRRDAAA